MSATRYRGACAEPDWTTLLRRRRKRLTFYSDGVCGKTEANGCGSGDARIEIAEVEAYPRGQRGTDRRSRTIRACRQHRRRLSVLAATVSAVLTLMVFRATLPTHPVPSQRAARGQLILSSPTQTMLAVAPDGKHVAQ